MAKKMKSLAFYLVGPIQYVEDYMSWRRAVADFLEELGHTAEFPWGEVYHGKEMRGEFKTWFKESSKSDWVSRVRKYMRSQVIRYDINALLRSNGIIFYLPKGAKTVGSYGEQTLAYYLKKWRPEEKKYQDISIFVIAEDGPEELSYWLIGCADWIFWSMDEFKEYFRKNYNRLEKRRRKITNEKVEVPKGNS